MSAPTRTRSNLGGIRLGIHDRFADLPVGELADCPLDVDGGRLLLIRGFSCKAYVFDADAVTDTHRILLVDDLRDRPVIVDTRVPGDAMGVELMAEGLLRGYAASVGVDVGPDPRRDPDTGRWLECSLHGGGIGLDCPCTPGGGLGNLGAAESLLSEEVFSGRAALAPDVLAREVIEAYHGIRRCASCGVLIPDPENAPDDDSALCAGCGDPA